MQLSLNEDELAVLSSVRAAAAQVPETYRVDDWWRLLTDQGVLDIDLRSGDGALMAAVVAEALGHALVPVHFGAYMTLRALLEHGEPRAGSQLALAAGRWAQDRTSVPTSMAVGHEVVPGEGVAEVLGDRADLFVIRRRAGWSVIPRDELIASEPAEWTQSPFLLRVAFDPAHPADPDIPGRANLLNIVLHAAELIGVAREAADRTRTYLLVRKQFGRQLAAFQALQHRLVDVTTEIAAAEAMVEFAAWKWGEGGDGADDAAWIHAAAGLASSSGLLALSEAFTFHGGMAMTDELWVHRWYRRAVRLAAFQGGERAHFESTGQLVAAGASLTISPHVGVETHPMTERDEHE